MILSLPVSARLNSISPFSVKMKFELELRSCLNSSSEERGSFSSSVPNAQGSLELDLLSFVDARILPPSGFSFAEARILSFSSCFNLFSSRFFDRFSSLISNKN